MRIALVLLVAAGCTTSDPGADGTGSGAAVEEPPAPLASGSYQVRSDIDLTVEALLPEQAANLVGTLRDFEANPARTLFDLAEDAGVPAVADVRTALPSYVEDKLEGWINAEIAKVSVGGVPVTQLAGNVVALAETALTQFALESELTIAGDIAGSATHTLKTLDLTPAGLDSRFDLSALPATVIGATPACSMTDSTIALGDHTYGLPYGEYIWSALDASFTADHGANIRETLGAAVSCPTIAAAVAAKCYWGVCVGHVAELTMICEKGLDEAVARAQAKVEALRFDAIHFAMGTASLIDSDRDGVVESLTGGVWTAEINAGMGLRTVPATFTATK